MGRDLTSTPDWMFFLEMNGYLLGLGPQKGKIPNFISQEMPITRKNLEIARNI
jgi:hypothetical protein